MYTARIENRDRDGIAIRNTGTGAIRFVRADWDDGPILPTIGTVDRGQMTATTASGILTFARMAGFSGEPGGTVREDVYFIHTAGDFFTRCDARWDPTRSAYTYWWAYDAKTPFIPTLHG